MTANTARIDVANVHGQPMAGMPMAVGFFFSFRLFLVLLTVRAFGVDAQTGVLVSIGLNLLFLAGAVFKSIGPAPTTLISPLHVSSFRWVMLFLGFSLCSFLWTAAVSIPAALAYWCAMAADVGIVVLLLRDGRETEVTAGLMKGYVSGACLLALISWILPSQSDLRLGDEGLLGPNQIGFACAFAVFFAQYLIRKGASEWRIPAAFLAITLLRSLSKTTIVAFTAAQIFILIRDASISRKRKILFVVVTCLVVAAFWNLLGAYFDAYTESGNNPETLTGRLGIWAFILDKAVERPWIGHGFHSVWKVIPSFGDFEARHAHNELLQQFYAYGVVGVAMVAGLYWSFYRQIRRFSQGPIRTLFIGLFLFVLVRGAADTEAFDLSLPLWTITLIGLTFARTGPSDFVEGTR